MSFIYLLPSDISMSCVSYLQKLLSYGESLFLCDGRINQMIEWVSLNNLYFDVGGLHTHLPSSSNASKVRPMIEITCSRKDREEKADLIWFDYRTWQCTKKTMVMKDREQEMITSRKSVSECEFVRTEGGGGRALLQPTGEATWKHKLFLITCS